MNGKAALCRAEELVRRLERVMREPAAGEADELYMGVDLGTANVVVTVVNRAGQPVAGALTPARVVRDGLVVEFLEAIAIVRRMVEQIEEKLRSPLERAATGIPPGTSVADVRGIVHVVEAAGLDVVNVVDEPTAAAAVLGVTEGAVVDVGGGTTGISVLREGRVVYTADEPTGGTHFTLVIAGRFGIGFEEAERLKLDPRRQREIAPIIRPCMEKVATIVEQHLAGQQVDTVYLVGGAVSFPDFDRVLEQRLGIPAVRPANPLLVTPLGIALHCLAGR